MISGMIRQLIFGKVAFSVERRNALPYMKRFLLSTRMRGGVDFCAHDEERFVMNGEEKTVYKCNSIIVFNDMVLA